jgi:hypothetical protein
MPLDGVSPEIAGWVTVNVAALVVVPPAVVMAIGPEPAPAGTTAVTSLSETTVYVLATVPPKLTELAPVNPVPVMSTVAPWSPLAGVKLEIVGAGS